ncbi:MAG: type I-E CRISPR-associated protein Cse1/CasA [Chloroflexi bacterium]|nr:type I-E CRISPR-associated protein Cse1/CasA [Chloroflexota bacterium]
MTYQFNLIDEKWIPCLLPGGRREEYGIRDALLKAAKISEISDHSPLVTAALHRLLLAILHTVFGPRSVDEWAALWHRGWDERRLMSYLDDERVHERFDLFHPQRPFCQVAGVSSRGASPATRLARELASPANAVLLFDHGGKDVLTAAEAARCLLAYQSYAPGGSQSRESAEFSSAKAAPLVNAALLLVKGSDLRRTLLLNLHWYCPDEAEPFSGAGADRPAWEAAAPPGDVVRAPLGYLDLLTWQSRRVRLLPEAGEGGQAVVSRAIILRGEQFEKGFSLHEKETMVAFKKNVKAGPGADPWPAVALQPERALWRDSLSLLESVAEQRSRPKMLDWLRYLVAEGHLAIADTLPLEVFGCVPDQANVVLWRHERLPVPTSYLSNPALVALLRESLQMAAGAASALVTAQWQLACLLAKPNAHSETDPRRLPPRARVKGLYIILRGEQFEKGFSLHEKETMVAFKKNVKAGPGADPWPAVALQPERALWRDSLSLLESVAEQRSRPKMLDWLRYLVAEGHLAIADTLPLEVFGCVPDQANVVLWRHERLPVPTSYLSNPALVALLRESLQMAAGAASALVTAQWQLACLLAKPNAHSETDPRRLPPRARVKGLYAGLGAPRSYWAALEAPFHQHMQRLATHYLAAEDGQADKTREDLDAWRRAARRAARAAYDEMAATLQYSERTARATALAENALRYRLNRSLPREPMTIEEETDEPTETVLAD